MPSLCRKSKIDFLFRAFKKVSRITIKMMGNVLGWKRILTVRSWKVRKTAKIDENKEG